MFENHESILPYRAPEVTSEARTNPLRTLDKLSKHKYGLTQLIASKRTVDTKRVSSQLVP